MFPVLSEVDSFESSAADAESIGERIRVFAMLIAVANFDYLIRRQNGAAVAFSFGIIAAFLVLSVLRVIGWCSEKQMCRVDARRVVTSVTNEHSGWYGTVVEFPRTAVSHDCTSINLHPSVSLEPLAIDSPGPQPTSFRLLINKIPELLRLSLRPSTACHRAEFSLPMTVAQKHFGTEKARNGISDNVTLHSETSNFGMPRSRTFARRGSTLFYHEAA